MSQIKKSSASISLPLTRDSVLQVLNWGANPESSPYSHHRIAKWCFKAALDVRGNEKQFLILKEVDTQFDIFVCDSYPTEQINSLSLDEIVLPKEWFVEWLSEAKSCF